MKLIFKRNGKIARFPKQEVLSASNQTLSPEVLSKFKYNVFKPCSFAICSDQETILGVLAEGNYNVVQKENIVDPSVKCLKYFGNSFYVNTIVLNEFENLLLAGEENRGKGKVIEYFLDDGEISKDYGHLEIGKVLCSTRKDNLCFFGGLNGNVRVLDTKKKQIILPPLETCIGDIYQLELCGLGGETMLTVGGRDTDHSDVLEGKSDYFNVSHLIRKVGLI